MSTTVTSHISFALKARKAVHNARLTLDAAKAAVKHARPEKQDAAKVEVEHAEDAFVGINPVETKTNVAAVEEATSVMKNVLDTPEPVYLFLHRHSLIVVEKPCRHDRCSTCLPQRSL